MGDLVDGTTVSYLPKVALKKEEEEEERKVKERVERE